MNSLIGERHTLANVDEFSGRLRAVKDTVAENLVLVVRIEALIAGHGLNEAVLRAHADADAILIHSRKSTADEMLRLSASGGTGYLL
ncbi:2-methylisocitrate lyase-like PEP mutase family enzyme [Bradyrhizobium sp. USDA 3686]|nr:isocitrate lyase/phosphoenolpyruvate mutase family protein [Bradyrhizobium sp. BWC-3-1]MBM7488008.1 2-methylisocitrate lyase-like PEP mutase family enzyme [Bradyrhizobium canariense]WOH57602.1 isocitrate lyase/phosphoenolpyruvate mutase family protein [Bradyrhizobium sp. BWC-3-1]